MFYLLLYRTTMGQLKLSSRTTHSVWPAVWCVPLATSASAAVTCTPVKRAPSTLEDCSISLLMLVAFIWKYLPSYLLPKFSQFYLGKDLLPRLDIKLRIPTFSIFIGIKMRHGLSINYSFRNKIADIFFVIQVDMYRETKVNILWVGNVN